MSHHNHQPRSRHRLLPGLILLIFMALQLMMGTLFLTQRDIDRDEGFYMESAAQLNRGNLPYCDYMFSQMPLSPFLLWVGHYFLGHSLYYGRLLMLIMMTIAHGAIFLYVLAKTDDLKTAAALTFLSLMTVMFSDWCSVVKSYAPAVMFSLLGWIFLLLFIDDGHSKKNLFIFLAGLFLSAAVNIRLMMAPLGLIAVIVILLRCWQKSIYRWFLLFVIGAFTSCVPFFFVLFSDWKRTLYFILVWHMRRGGHEELGGWQSRYDSLVQFFTWPQNITLLAFMVFSLVLVLPWGSVHVQLKKSVPQKSPGWRTGFSATFIGAIFLFFLNIIPNPVHFQYFTIVVPFLLLLAMPAVFWLVNHQKKLVRGGMVMLVIFYSYFNVLRIVEWSQAAVSPPPKSSWSLNNFDRVTALIQGLTHADAIILSAWPGYAYEAGRRVPKRWEMGIFGYALLPYYSPEEAEYYHMAYDYNLPAIVHNAEVDALIFGIDTLVADVNYLRGTGLPRYTVGDTDIFLLRDKQRQPLLQKISPNL
ncbi:hypothetical protein ACFL27_15225 [candidate division CSSED10-310 bacterium]|uniref:Glycosyltransferase RgtA/B/C/D-like domain-containing protein n=1 Tax=candidate division CSSED10-310 bacterium TaxID=2855610 RepID=A0ABV6YZC4_UNCC1